MLIITAGMSKQKPALITQDGLSDTQTTNED
jgi:hypothetical protein